MHECTIGCEKNYDTEHFDAISTTAVLLLPPVEKCQLVSTAKQETAG